MSELQDLTGQTFGRLKIISRAGNKGKYTAWNCLCDCENTKVVIGRSLKRGYTKSCGCLHKELTTKRSTTHGMSNSMEYRSWKMMIQRCTNPNNSNFKNYGERGITVCNQWMKFENFLGDMGLRRSLRYSIHRVNNDGNYEPLNCRWAPPSEQAINKRKSLNNTSGVKGVHWSEDRQVWRTQIRYKGKCHSVYYGPNFEDAVQARKDAELKYWVSSQSADSVS